MVVNSVTVACDPELGMEGTAHSHHYLRDQLGSGWATTRIGGAPVPAASGGTLGAETLRPR